MRKLTLMAAFMCFSDSLEKAWFVGSMITCAFILVHAWCRPFDEVIIDCAEFLGLLSFLFILQTSIIFKVLADPNNPSRNENSQMFVKTLEVICIVLLVLNVVFASYAEWVVFNHVRRAGFRMASAEEEEGEIDYGGDYSTDYKIHCIKRDIKDTEEDLERLKTALVPNTGGTLWWVAENKWGICVPAYWRFQFATAY